MLKLENYCLGLPNEINDSGKNHQKVLKPLARSILGTNIIMVLKYYSLNN